MSLITAEMLIRAEASPKGAVTYADALAAACAARGVVDKSAVIALLENVLHESGGLTAVAENMTYSSAERIHEVFPSHFPSVASAQPYVHNGYKLGEVVYGKIGGFDFRGRGLAQLTGRANYVAYALDCGKTIGSVGAWMTLPEGASDSAVWWFNHSGCATLALGGDLLGVRRRWTGCPTSQMPIGWADVQLWHRRLAAAMAPPPDPVMA